MSVANTISPGCRELLESKQNIHRSGQRRKAWHVGLCHGLWTRAVAGQRGLSANGTTRLRADRGRDTRGLCPDVLDGQHICHTRFRDVRVASGAGRA
jgi:hypothetical protein